VLSNPNVLKIFQITGFDQIFEIYPSLAAAVSGNGNGHTLAAFQSAPLSR
jgi:anti-anti-sigma regulatory factor